MKRSYFDRSMKIIAGLGNPGAKYEGTPHNVGFDAVDLLCDRWRGSWRVSGREMAQTAEVTVDGNKVLLVKPMTFMNLSGQALREIMRNRPVELSDLMVISDEAQLDIGRLRMREMGSAGGHNGLRSLIECLGSDAIPRLRIGIRPQSGISGADMVRYVLSRPRPEDARRLDSMIEVAADAVECWLRQGLAFATNKFNGYALEGK